MQKAKKKIGRPKGSRNRQPYEIEEARIERERNRKPVGRPSTYSREKAVEICTEIATTTRGLDRICDENPTFPQPRTVYRWLSENEDFRQLYRQARVDQCQLWADQLVEIADTPKVGQISTISGRGKDGKPTVKETKLVDMVERTRLRLETRRWLLAKLRPREYGDKIEIEDGRRDPLDELLDEWKKQSAKIETAEPENGGKPPNANSA
jgi:hypothetical protein